MVMLRDMPKSFYGRTTWASLGLSTYFCSLCYLFLYIVPYPFVGLHVAETSLQSAWVGSSSSGSSHNGQCSWVSGSNHLSPLVGGKDLHHLPILRNGPSRDLDIHPFRIWTNFFIAVRLLRIFFGNDITNEALKRFRTPAYLLHGSDPGVEKEFQFVDPLRCVDILVVSHPADGGLMHLDIFSHVAKEPGA